LNASVHDDRKVSVETSLEDLEKCSLLVTLPSELNRLSDADIKSKIHPFLKTVQAGKDKIGIVMNVVEDRPQFVHQTIADYFTARWFSKNFEFKREVLEDVLFGRSYGIVRNIFDRILARGCPLHCAVLEWDTDAVESLLKGGSDVSAVDSGGRTVMHLIAAQGPGSRLCKEISNILLRHGAHVGAKDKVLQWTSLRYAVKTENWFAVERLMEERCNTADIELITQRVNDESYVGKIIDSIKDENCSLLLRYLSQYQSKQKMGKLGKKRLRTSLSH